MIPVQSTAKYTVGLPYETSLNIVYNNAMKCWQKEYSVFGGDAFVVEKKQFSERSAMVTVRRSAPDIAFQPAFMIVVIRRLPEQSEIEVSEGSCAYNCEMNFTMDVNRWLDGNESCSERN